MLSVTELAQRYAYPAPLNRPWIRTNFVMSLDGAAQDHHGVTSGLGGSDDSAIFAVLRSLADVILVGAGTTRVEGYQPVREHEIHRELRDADQTAVPPIAVVSDRLEVPEALRAPGQLVITTARSDANVRADLARTMDVLVAGEEHIDWSLVLTEFARRGWHRILCEGGPTLHGELIAAGLVDELCLTIAAVLVSGDALRIAQGTATNQPMELADLVRGDGILGTRWVRSPGT